MAIKQKEWKLKLTKQDERALEIQKSNNQKEVDYRNKVNKRTNEVQKELIEFFRPFIGKKIRTISGYGDWSKLVKSSLRLYLDDLWEEKFTVTCRPSAGSLYFEIKTTYQSDSINYKGEESSHTNYVSSDFYVGSWDESTGNLYRVEEEGEIKPRKTNWTVEELAGIRKKLVETRDELRNLTSSIREFDR